MRLWFLGFPGLLCLFGCGCRFGARFTCVVRLGAKHDFQTTTTRDNDHAARTEARTVASGASCSPAALQGLTGRPVTCCWPGCQELGTWEHIAWTCSHRPRSPIVPPPRPRLSVTARLGWIEKGDCSDIHRWLEVVQNRIWQVNHQSD